MSYIYIILGGFLAFFLCFAIGELGVRYYFRRFGSYYVWIPHTRYLFHLDLEVVPELERDVRIEINRDGERGGKPPGPHEKAYRILVAGGSAAECGSLDQAKSWPGVLEGILQKPENLGTLGVSKVHMGNIARSGVASQQLDFIFERLLPRYRRLDAIVIMVGGNDVFFWLRDGAPASYTPRELRLSDAFLFYPECNCAW